MTIASSPLSTEPDWLAALRAAAAATSIAQAAASIGMSRSAVSLVLAGKYGARTQRIEGRVREMLLGHVACPGLGECITLDRCATLAARPFTATSSRAARLWRACQDCANRKMEDRNDS